MRFDVNEFSTAEECEIYLNDFSKKRKITKTDVQVYFKREENQTKYLLLIEFM